MHGGFSDGAVDGAPQRRVANASIPASLVRRSAMGVALVFLATACADGSGAARPAVSGRVSAGPWGASAARPAGPTVPASASALTAAGPQVVRTVAPPPAALACAPGAVGLAVDRQRGDQSLGIAVLRLTLRNRSTRPCALRGYPTVSLLDAQHRPEGVNVRRTGAEVTRVVLEPGEAAYALAATSETPGTAKACLPPSAFVVLDLPGWSRSLTAPGAVPRCGGDLRINPLRSP